MGISVSEAAQLADQCYNISHNDAAVNLPDGWNTVTVNLPPGGWDTFFAVFIQKERRQVVLAVRGTHQTFNYLNVIALVISLFTGRAQEPAGQHHVNAAAINLYNQLQHHENPPKWEITLRILVFLETSENITAIGFRRVRRLVFNPPIGLQRCLEEFRRLMQPIATMKSSHPRHEITIVGHSLGAAMAQLAAIHAGLRCIVFENPGVKDIVDQLPEYTSKWENNPCLKMVSYQSAPNVINTFQGQLGDVYRMKLPHVGDDSFFHLAFHGCKCFVSSIVRLVIFGTLVALAANTTGFSPMFAAIECWFIFVGWTFTATMYGFLPGLFIHICSYVTWLMGQHSISKIATYMTDKSTDQAKRRIVKMVRWPIRPGVKSIIKRWIRYVIPVQQDTHGIHNLFNPNGMVEAGFEGLHQYLESKQKIRRRTTSTTSSHRNNKN